MRTSRPDYADGTGIAKIPEDEPVFVLRAQDRFAAPLVRRYGELVHAAGGDPRVVAGAMQLANLMAAWPVKKDPDFPTDVPAEEQESKPRSKKKRHYEEEGEG